MFRALGIIGVETYLSEKKQVNASNKIDQLNHIPEEPTGNENIPAPTAVPATMVIPAASEGELSSSG